MYDKKSLKAEEFISHEEIVRTLDYAEENKDKTYIFGFGMIDILFRILNIINGYIPIKEIKTFINTYIPESVPSVINKYTKGIANIGLTWIYVIIMAIFLYFIVKLFIKRKKI